MKLLPNSYPDFNKLGYKWGEQYTGETKKRTLTYSIEQQKDSMAREWNYY